jgi:DNA-binding NarL/FixJ family response regulator
MGSAPKLRFVDRSGIPFSPRYHTAMNRLSRTLWQRYPSIRDEAEQDNAMEETLRRVAQYEQRYGTAENLPALIRRFFSCVASTMFVRKPHPVRYEESRQSTDLDALNVAPQHSSEFEQSLTYFRGLSKRERDILSLKEQGFKAKEIADKAGITEANVNQIVHRIRERLK